MSRRTDTHPMEAQAGPAHPPSSEHAAKPSSHTPCHQPWTPARGDSQRSMVLCRAGSGAAGSQRPHPQEMHRDHPGTPPGTPQAIRPGNTPRGERSSGTAQAVSRSAHSPWPPAPAQPWPPVPANHPLGAQPPAPADTSGPGAPRPGRACLGEGWREPSLHTETRRRLQGGRLGRERVRSGPG